MWILCFNCFLCLSPREHLLSQWTSHVLMHLITCEWQLYTQGSQIVTLIGLRAAPRFWVAKTGANQVWKVLRPTHIKSNEGLFWKSTQLPEWEEEHKGKVFANVDLSYESSEKYKVLEMIRKGSTTLFGRWPNLVISSWVAQFSVNCGLSLCNCTLMAEFGI